MSLQPPDKALIEEISAELTISEAFIEKDWYVTQVILLLSEIRVEGVQLVFSGGTALSKAHGLLKRFSEDIDFRVLTDNKSRKALSSFKKIVIDHLRKHFSIEDHQIKARDGNKYFSIDLEYQSQFERSNALRPHVQIELATRAIQLPCLYCPVSSFVAPFSE